MTTRKGPLWFLALSALLGCGQGQDQSSIDPNVDFVVKQVTPEDGELVEEWVLETTKQDTHGVGAVRLPDVDWAWQVSVSVMEFVREEPLETELVSAITVALSEVNGVSQAVQEDREVWAVNGAPDGADLVRSVALVVSQFSNRTASLLDRHESAR
jgi:hypothetical protein